MDRRIVEAGGAQRLHGVPAGRGWTESQLHGEVAERPGAPIEVGASVVVLRVARELFVCALCTEVVCMRARSVMALVGAGDDDREQFALLAGEPGGAEHDPLVELH